MNRIFQPAVASLQELLIFHPAITYFSPELFHGQSFINSFLNNFMAANAKRIFLYAIRVFHRSSNGVHFSNRFAPCFTTASLPVLQLLYCNTCILRFASFLNQMGTLTCLLRMSFHCPSYSKPLRNLHSCRFVASPAISLRWLSATRFQRLPCYRYSLTIATGHLFAWPYLSLCVDPQRIHYSYSIKNLHLHNINLEIDLYIQLDHTTCKIRKTSKSTTRKPCYLKLTTRQTPTSKSLCHKVLSRFDMSLKAKIRRFRAAVFMAETLKRLYFKPFSRLIFYP
jgi:hypothetical protein